MALVGSTSSGALTGLATGGPLGAILDAGTGLLGGIFGEIGAGNQRRRRKKYEGELQGLIGKQVYDQGAALSYAAQGQQPLLNGLSRQAVDQYGVGQGPAMRHFADQAIDARSRLAGDLYFRNTDAVNENDRYYRGLIARLVG